MVGDSGKIRVREGDSAERRGTQHVAGRRLAIFAEKESRRGAEIGVSPAVQNDSRNVTSGIESGTGKHRSELLANLPLVVAKWSGNQLRASQVPLLLG